MKDKLKSNLFLCGGIVLLVVILDQIIKYWVRANIGDGPNIEVTSWFYLCFVENNGMAFGMSFFDKIYLTLFRIAALFGLGYCVYYILSRKYSLGLAIGVTLILAGALGNIIDCVFFGVIYDGGDWLYGKVVDMFHFPLIHSTWPDWTPWAGQSLVFFRPVFNFADAAITTGVAYSLLFHSKEMGQLLEWNDEEKKTEDNKKSGNTTNSSENDEA
ncbi:MAG: signal peptidase II [Paludibacteraceae bacterium]|nr:signal peptidase II [Paludibacteraceae bacterium]